MTDTCPKAVPDGVCGRLVVNDDDGWPQNWCCDPCYVRNMRDAGVRPYASWPEHDIACDRRAAEKRTP